MQFSKPKIIYANNHCLIDSNEYSKRELLNCFDLDEKRWLLTVEPQEISIERGHLVLNLLDYLRLGKVGAGRRTFGKA